MVKSGDRLRCTNGNDLYLEGGIYTIGDFVNDKYFQLLTGHNNEHWYATVDHKGICVRFDSMETEYSDAWFVKISNKNSDRSKFESDSLDSNNLKSNSLEELIYSDCIS